jgi:hypothetical protein
MRAKIAGLATVLAATVSAFAPARLRRDAV